MIFVRKKTHMNTHLHQSKSLIPTKKRGKKEQKEPKKEKEKEREATSKQENQWKFFKKRKKTKEKKGREWKSSELESFLFLYLPAASCQQWVKQGVQEVASAWVL
jgi:hypothetical protein